MPWLPIDDRYEISDDGLVLNRITGRILSPENDRRGYYRVNLYGKHQKIHRLVAKRFLPAPTEEGLVVDHIDRDRMNNCAENLRWVTLKVNSANRTPKW